MCVTIRFTVDGKGLHRAGRNRGRRVPIVTRGGGLTWVEWEAADNDKADLHLNPLEGPGRLRAGIGSR